MKMVKINLGSGSKYLEGYINCDIVNSNKVDKIFDLNTYPYPFKSNFANEILMDNVLEHLDNVIKTMEEIHRILKKNGIAKIYVPYAKSEGALQDPTHRHFFTEKSMHYFAPDFDYNYYTKNHFRIIKNQLFCGSGTRLGYFKRYIPFKILLKIFLFNIYDGIYFELECIK